MQKKYNIILSYEESFARDVAVRLIIEEPLLVWHYLIPFMFVFELLKRKREARIFAMNFLFTKKLALDAADDINGSEEQQNRLSRIKDKTRDRLTSLKLYSWETHQKQMAEINLLIDHYLKLLITEGNSYESLVKNAYQTRDNYQSFLSQLTSAEKAIDQAVIKTLGETEEVWQLVLTKQTVIGEMRAKRVDRIF